jgi:dihydrofolate reductase
MTKEQKIILYIATSEDGFIADKNGGVDWLPALTDENVKADEGDEFGYKALMNETSIIVMGSRSYEQILGFGEWAWADKMTYVFTSQPLITTRKDINFVSEEVKNFMDKIRKQKTDKNIWLLGGAKLIKSFVQENLIDECIITVSPVKLGEGIALDLRYENFILSKTKSCSHGMVQKFYNKKIV